MDRWLVYQKERFPLKQYVPMVGAFSFCAVSYSAFLRGAVLSFWGFGVAFATSLAFFMLLRVADEFKDFEEDSRFRPYRPVPRGLVKLSELAWVGAGLLVIQLAAALVFQPKLLPLLVMAWVYFGLMSKEFFVADWLRKHPLVYMVSHMLIMPLIDLYATACDWMPAGQGSHALASLSWFLIASFFNGAVIEFGRKIRCTKDEEEGVETYSFLWGHEKAIGSWLGAMALAGVMAIMAGIKAGALITVLVLLGAVLVGAVATGIWFLKDTENRKGSVFEMVSGVWVLAMYIALGGIPLLQRFLTGGSL